MSLSPHGRRGTGIGGLALLSAVVVAVWLGTVPGERAGEARASVAGSTARCFGAAARAPGSRCTAKVRSVRPTPDDALITPNVGCVPPKDPLPDQFRQCQYGVAQERATATVALVGDSHAAHWRAAIERVALTRGWHVLEFARPHCPLTLATPDGPYAGFCTTYNRQMLAYLAGHPEISTIFVSVNHFVRVVPAPGQDEPAARLDGFKAALGALPASVSHVIAIRDNPMNQLRTPDCVTRAVESRAYPGLRCAVPRSHALREDLEVAAVTALGRPRGAVVDFTRIFCDSRRCFPVIGGVLVHKDQDHLGQLFVRTLAPLLLQRVDAIVPRPRSAG